MKNPSPAFKIWAAFLLFLFTISSCGNTENQTAVYSADIIIYGGTSAAVTAASIAIDKGVSPQQLPYEELKTVLLGRKQRLEL